MIFRAFEHGESLASQVGVDCTPFTCEAHCIQSRLDVYGIQPTAREAKIVKDWNDFVAKYEGAKDAATPTE